MFWNCSASAKLNTKIGLSTTHHNTTLQYFWPVPGLVYIINRQTENNTNKHFIEAVLALIHYFFQICIPLLLCIHKSSQAPNPHIKLQSRLPDNPIEDSFSWAWGRHPDGLDYKAKNSLTNKQCLANPCSLFGTPACKTTFFHCADYKCIQKTKPCKKFCKVLGSCWNTLFIDILKLNFQHN